VVHKVEDQLWKVIKQGKATCGVYGEDIAATKVEQVKALARTNGFPLLAKWN